MVSNDHFIHNKPFTRSCSQNKLLEYADVKARIADVITQIGQVAKATATQNHVTAGVSHKKTAHNQKKAVVTNHILDIAQDNNDIIKLNAGASNCHT